ncbi:MAG: GC-type dockerin domain-anchored protein [Phycisphaerae bacterium]
MAQAVRAMWSSAAFMVASVLGASGASAQVTMYTMRYSAEANQTTPGLPPATTRHVFGSHVYAQTGIDFFDCWLTPPLATRQTIFDYDNFSGFEYESGSYATQALLLVAWPRGTYRFDVFGGFSPAQVINWSRVAEWWPSAQPTISAATFNALQAIDADAPLVIAFNGFTYAYPATSGSTRVEITNLFDSTVVYSRALTQPVTSVTVPAGTLEPGSPYEIEIAHVAMQSGTDSTQPGSPVVAVSFERVTRFPATCIAPPACIADFNQDGGVDGADIESFFHAWETGGASGDVNQDGGVDGGDVETFIGRWEAGC